MSNDLKFSFYSVVKDEDAPPYLSDKLLVVADGLGGAGSTVHKIDREKHDCLKEELLSTAFADFDGETLETLRPYLDELLESMIDEKDDTSALWASRIVIGRFVYALTKDDTYSAERLKDENVRKELVEFISQGLYDTVRHFELKCSDASSTRLLPSTLAAIRYSEIENNVLAEVIWAGDSRLYALTSEGIKLISEDDEDGSGALNNLFYVAENPCTHLHYRAYYLPKPCVLMAVSDGIFDPFSPYDSIGTENILLSTLMDSASIEEFRAKLHDLFLMINQDDATVSFRAFGFDSFEQLKEHYAKRGQYLSEVWNKKNQLKESLSVINLSVEDANSYVATRTLDKYPKICETLVNSYAAGENDIALSGKLITNALDAKLSEMISEAIEEKNKNNKESLNGIFEELRNSPSVATFKTVFVDSTAYSAREQGLLENVKHCGKILAYSIKHRNEKLEKYNALKEERVFLVSVITKLVSEIDLRIAEYERQYDNTKLSLDSQSNLSRNLSSFKDFKDNWNKETELVRNKISDLKVYRSFWERARGDLIMLRHPSSCIIRFECKETERICRTIVKSVAAELMDTPKHPNLFKAIEAHVEISLTCLFNYAVSVNEAISAAKKYDDAVSDLKKYICNKNAYKKFFKRSIMEKYSFNVGDDPSPKAELPRDVALHVIIEALNNKEAAAADIVSALAENYDKVSVIDAIYNPKRLSQFREYHRLSHIPKESFIEFDNELKALEASCSSLKPL